MKTPLSLITSAPHVSDENPAIFSDSSTRRIATFTGGDRERHARLFLESVRLVETILIQADGDLDDRAFRGYVVMLARKATEGIQP